MDDDNLPALMLHALQGLTQAGQVSWRGLFMVELELDCACFWRGGAPIRHCNFA